MNLPEDILRIIVNHVRSDLFLINKYFYIRILAKRNNLNQ